MDGHRRGLLVVSVITLLFLFLFIRSLFLSSVQATVQYDVLYFHKGGCGKPLWIMDANAPTGWPHVFSKQLIKPGTGDARVIWENGTWPDNWWVGVSDSWTVVFWAESRTRGIVDVTVSLTDKTPVTSTGISISGSLREYGPYSFNVSGWADRDANTTWLNDPDGADSRTLGVKIELMSGDPVTIYFDGRKEQSRLNTGIIVPENFSQLIFVVPSIPLVVGRWVNRRKNSPSRALKKRE